MAELCAKLFNYISSLGPYSQVGAGAVSGWLIGLSIIKIGKFAAAMLGGAIILIKIAEIEGLIHIDWTQIQQNAQNISKKPFGNMTLPQTGEIPAQIHHFVISFIGGSLVGVGSA